MSDKIKVPKGMLRNLRGLVVEDLALEAALRWLDSKLVEMSKEAEVEYTSHSCGYVHAISDVRRMFRAPDPDAEIADLLWSVGDKEDFEHNAAIREAYLRGRQTKTKVRDAPDGE